MEIITKSPEETAAAAGGIVNWLKQHNANLVLLRGDLGVGKTLLVGAIVDFLGGDQTDVSSPTFTLHNIYRCEGLQVHHYDLYRLEQPGIMLDELEEAAAEPDSICFVEWPASGVDNISPSGATAVIDIKRQNTGDTHRLLNVSLV